MQEILGIDYYLLCGKCTVTIYLMQCYLLTSGGLLYRVQNELDFRYISLYNKNIRIYYGLWNGHSCEDANRKDGLKNIKYMCFTLDVSCSLLAIIEFVQWLVGKGPNTCKKRERIAVATANTHLVVAIIQQDSKSYTQKSLVLLKRGFVYTTDGLGSACVATEQSEKHIIIHLSTEENIAQQQLAR